MAFKVKWEDAADVDLEAIDSAIALKIYNRVESYLIFVPRELGKRLTGNHSGLYRYRYGDYRIIYKILEEENTIVILRVGHRKNIY